MTNINHRSSPIAIKWHTLLDVTTIIFDELSLFRHVLVIHPHHYSWQCQVNVSDPAGMTWR